MNAEAPPFAPIETDCVIIGAGPIGLFPVFELGLLEAQYTTPSEPPHKALGVESTTSP